MRLSYLGKLPLFFTLGIDMRQFLLGTVQHLTIVTAIVSIAILGVCQFLLGTVQHNYFGMDELGNEKQIKLCQFLLGTVQQN